MKTLQPPGKIDMNYLKSQDVGKVIAKGLAELYIQQPQFPVDFLGNWLLNYSKTQQSVIQLDKKQVKKEELKYSLFILFSRLKQLHQSEENILKQKHSEETTNEKKKVETDYRKKVETELFHEQLLSKDFCDFLLNQKQVSGVYVGYVDFPKRQIGENEDEEQAHLDTNQPKGINYIASCQSHRNFMIGKMLPLDQGVTAQVFQEPPPPEDNPDNPDQTPVVKSQAVYIPQVTQEPRMVYFQWPKLGAYFAVPMVYSSCLLEQGLDVGIEERVKFKKAQSEMMKEREIKELDFQERLRAAAENIEDYEKVQEEYNTYKAELVDLQEPEFTSQKKEYVLCIDTLGQDRTLSEEERSYFEEWGYFYAEQWEEKEKQLLSNDIDFMINYYETVSPKEKSESLTLQEEQALDGASKFDEIKDREKEYNYEIQSLKFEKLTQQITDQTLYSEFLALKEMRVFKFPSVLAALLLFLGFSKNEIFQEGTNLLDWEKAKSYVNDGLFEKVIVDVDYNCQIGAYNPRGAKPQKILDYAKVNRVQKRIEKIEGENVEQYNVCYGKMLRWLNMAINLRKQDIEIRRSKIEQKKALREQKQQEIEKVKEDKEKALEEFKAALPPEELETFNQEEWEEKYDLDHPLPELPEDVEWDVDEDLDESN